MRISDVEMSSTFTPASASARKKVAETPGCERIPAPTNEILPMPGSYSRDSKPISALRASRAAITRSPSALGSVNVMSVRCVAAAETFCTIMSMLTCASATVSKMAAASPGRSGTPTTVTLASLRSCATPEMIGCSTSSSPSLV